MAEESNGGPKTETVAKFSVAALTKKIPAYKDFIKKGEIAATANRNHEEAKALCRDQIKKALGLDEDTVIDFNKSGDDVVTVIKKLEVKKRRNAIGLQDDLLK